MKRDINLKDEVNSVLFDKNSSFDLAFYKSEPLFRYEIDQGNYKLAQLLIALKSFNQRVMGVKQKLRINAHIETADHFLFSEIITVLYDKDNKHKGELTVEAKEIMRIYQLGQEWFNSISFLFISNKLIVPGKDTGIHVHIPVPKNDREEKYSSVLEELAEQREWWNKINFPSIYFTKYVSPKQFKNWVIRQGFDRFFRAIQASSPKPKRVRINKKTIFWGHMASVYIQEGVTGWTDIVKSMEEQINQEEYLEDYITDFTDEVPNSSVLQQCYKQYIKYLKELEKKTRDKGPFS